MDPALLTTYTALLTTLQRRSKGDASSCSVDELALMAEYLTEAMGWAWSYPGSPWPNTVEGATVTLSGGSFPWSAIFYAGTFSVYQSDPRPLPPGHPWPAPLPCRRYADGLWPLRYEGCRDTAPSTLFVLFQRRAPEFTSTPVLPATPYAIGDVVYDAAAGKTGQCYRAVSANTTATPPDATLADPTKWELMVVPRFLRDAVLQYARGGWLRDKTEEDKTDGYEERAEKMLWNEWNKQQEVG